MEVVASFLGCSHLQYLIAYCKQSNTGGENGLGMRLGDLGVREPMHSGKSMHTS